MQGAVAVPILEHMKSTRGFTIIELMTTIAVFGVMLAIGTPAMKQTILNNRLVSQLNALGSSLALARSEAVKQNQLAVVCVSTDGAACAAGEDWNKGWMIFVDKNGDLSPDFGGGDGCADGSDDDCLIASEAALTGQATLRGADSVPAVIAYNGSGTARCDADDDGALENCVNADTYFVLCDERGDSHARALAVSQTGRTAILTTQIDGTALECTP